MTILSQNLKTIRKNLNCTQMALSQVLDVGFRTYVRYEAGERDAPVALLVKLAKLGNISLDRLLTTKIEPEDMEIQDVDKPTGTTKKIEIIDGSAEEGRVIFKGIKSDFLVSTNKEEKKLLSTFRKMNRNTQEKCLLDLEWMINNSKRSVAAKAGQKKKVAKKVIKAKNAVRLKKLAKSIKKITLKG